MDDLISKLSPPEPPRAAPTLLRRLDQRAAESPQQLAYRFLKEGEVETERMSFGELRQRALVVAERLTALNAPGERAILLYPQGLAFLVAFFGCLYAGVIAVPASVPNRKRGLDIVRRIASDCDARWLLSTGENLEQFRDDSARCPALSKLLCADTEDFRSVESDWQPPSLEPSDPALLQYTSGATGPPRGVIVTHGNLSDNHRQVAACLDSDPSTIYVSWLPMFHDMGLGIALQAVWVGVECVLMPPRAFIQEPRRWLSAISRYRGTTSGGPDFAFELCVRRIGEAERAGLDLSSWRVAYNGSEPVKVATLDRFAGAFAANGFRRQAFHPVYGLAEATLLVSAEPPGESPIVREFSIEGLERGEGLPSSSEPGRALVSYGRAAAGNRLIIVEPQNREVCAPGRVGEIWIQSASVAGGYWNRDAETRATFQAFTRAGDGPYLRSGDLGFIAEDRLFVTGRRRDVIVIGDQSHYPQDIEATASESHPALVPHGCAAFALDAEEGGGLIVVQEVLRSALKKLDGDRAIEAIRGAIGREHALHPRAVVLLKPATLPRTTSGKVRRANCRAAYRDHSLETLMLWTAAERAPEGPARFSNVAGEEANVRANRLIEWLRQNAGDLISLHHAEEKRRPLALLGDFAKQGVFGLQVDPMYGGLGLGHVDTARVIEQLAAIDFVLALRVGFNNYLGVEPIAKHASSALKAWLLPGLAQGTEFAAFAFSEPGSATPASATASKIKGEERWRLSGSKYVEGVTGAPSVVTVFVDNREPIGTSAFVLSGSDLAVHGADEGFWSELGFSGRVLALDEVTVPRESMLGDATEGMDIAREASLHTRLAIAAACVGGMKRCAQLVSRSQSQLRTPNGKRTPNPVMLSRLGSVKARVTALECLVHQIAQAIDAGHQVPSEAFVACKLLGPELLLRSIDDLRKLGVSLTPADSQRLFSLHRDAGLLQDYDGLPDAVAESTGAAVMTDLGSLNRLVNEILVAPAVLPRVQAMVDTVRLRMTKLDLPLAQRAQRWAHTRAGELACWIAVLAAVDGRRRRAPSPELQHACAWAQAQLEHALSLVRYGTPSEVAAVDSSEVAATFASYAHAIGDPEP